MPRATGLKGASSASQGVRGFSPGLSRSASGITCARREGERGRSREVVGGGGGREREGGGGVGRATLGPLSMVQPPRRQVPQPSVIESPMMTSSASADAFASCEGRRERAGG